MQMDKGENNAVVYTPCSIHDDGLHTYNVTVPEGMICSDVLPDPGMPKDLYVFQLLVCRQVQYTLIAVHLLHTGASV